MAICKFWEQGNCRFGAGCRNEHPGSDRPSGFSRPKNAFEVLNRDSPGHGQYRDSGSSKFGDTVPANTYNLNEATIRTDLTTDLPIYIFSCYGPGKDAPLQLFGGQPREQSYEEWRLRFYELAAQNRIPEAKAEEDSMRTTAQQQIQSVLNDIPGAIRYITEGANKHPNRIDVIEGRARSENESGFGSNEIRSGAGGFGPMQAVPNAGNPFAKQENANPFAKTENANPFAKPARPAFGAPSLPGANSPFGKPQPQQAMPGPFDRGASQNPFNRAAPGNAPSFQQNTTTTSPFANPFAKPPMPSANPTPNNPFMNTKAAQAQTSSPFGTSGNAAASPFGKPASGGSPFTQNQPANPFGSTQTPAANPFASNASSQAQSNPFASGGSGAGPGANPFALAGNSQSASIAPLRELLVHADLPASVPPTHNAANGEARPDISIFNHIIPNNLPGIRVLDNERPPVLRQFRGQPTEFPIEVKTVFEKEGQPGRETTREKKVNVTIHERPFYVDTEGCRNRVFNVQEKNWNGRPAEDPPESVYTPALREGLEFMLRHGAFKDGVMPEYPLPRADTKFDV